MNWRASSYLPWLSLLAFWVLVEAGLLAVGATPLLEGGLIGTDGYMRLVRVELLHETGAWFDGRIPRANAPYGDTLHWTRPFDLLLLGAAWPLTPFLGFKQALFWGGAFVSPLLLLATGWAMIWASKPVIDPEDRPFVVLAFLAQLGVMAYSLPGRVDHHTLQMLLIALTVGLMLRFCTGCPPARRGVLVGLVLGIGLWVSVEFMLLTVVAMAAVWLTWLRHGRAGSIPALCFAVGLAGSLVLALLVERPWSDLLAEEYDRISVVFLTVALLHLGVWAALVWAERGLRTPLWLGGRLLGSGLLALSGGAALYGLYPKSFGAGLADIDPELARVFLSNIKELQPLLLVGVEDFGRFLTWLGAAAICLPFALGMAWAKRRALDWPVWAFFALALALYLTLSLRYVRFAPFASLLAVVPLACLVVVLRRRLGGIAKPIWRDAARSLATVVVIFGITGVGLWLGFRPDSTWIPRAAASAGAEACEIAPIAAYLNRPRTFGDRPRIIATHVDWGPELLYRTRHAVVAAPYHRNAPGILDIHRMFSAVDPASSKAIVEARGIELALLCPSLRERLLYANEALGATLYQRLLAGWTPDWLTPVALPDHLAANFRLYRVIF